MLHILVHTNISMTGIAFQPHLFSNFFIIFGLAAYPWYHVIILVQMTQLMLNIYITQISVVGDRQLKYSAFIPILLWPANTYLIQNSQAVKKVCGPQKGYGEKRYEIQGGGQETAVMVG